MAKIRLISGLPKFSDKICSLRPTFFLFPLFGTYHSGMGRGVCLSVSLSVSQSVCRSQPLLFFFFQNSRPHSR